MALYSNDILSLHTVDMSSEELIPAVTSLQTTLQTALVTPDTGTAYRQVQTIASQEPVISFSTEDVMAFLALMTGLHGKCITSDGSHPGLQMFAAKHDACAQTPRATGATNLKGTIGDGHILIDNVTCAANENVSLSAMAHAFSSDDTDPIAVVYNVTLGSMPSATLHTLHSVVVGSITVNNVVSVEISYNVTAQKPRYAGSLYPTLVDVQRVDPVITITTQDPSILDATKIPATGLSCLHANSYIAFRKRDPNGGLVATGDSVHSKVSFLGMAHVATPYSASGTGTAATTIEIQTASTDRITQPILWTHDTTL